MLCSNRQKKIRQAFRSNVYSQYYIKKNYVMGTLRPLLFVQMYNLIESCKLCT